MLHHLIFPGEFLVGQTATDCLFHASHKAVEIVRLPVVVGINILDNSMLLRQE